MFSNIPGCGARGALFDLGADYYQVGGKIGELAGRVFGGESPASLTHPLRSSGRVVDQPGRARADQGRMVVPQGDSRTGPTSSYEQKGPVRRHPRAEFAKAARQPARPSRLWKIGLVSAAEPRSWTRHSTVCREGLKEAGLVDGRDFKINYRNAQGDIATLNSICDEMSGNDTDW